MTSHMTYTIEIYFLCIIIREVALYSVLILVRTKLQNFVHSRLVSLQVDTLFTITILLLCSTCLDVFKPKHSQDQSASDETINLSPNDLARMLTLLCFNCISQFIFFGIFRPVVSSLSERRLSREEIISLLIS